MLRTVRVVEIDLGEGEREQSVTQGSNRAARILRPLGNKDLNPDPREAQNSVAQ